MKKPTLKSRLAKGMYVQFEIGDYVRILELVEVSGGKLSSSGVVRKIVKDYFKKEVTHV